MGLVAIINPSPGPNVEATLAFVVFVILVVAAVLLLRRTPSP